MATRFVEGLIVNEEPEKVKYGLDVTIKLSTILPAALPARRVIVPVPAMIVSLKLMTILLFKVILVAPSAGDEEAIDGAVALLIKDKSTVPPLWN